MRPDGAGPAKTLISVGSLRESKSSLLVALLSAALLGCGGTAGNGSAGTGGGPAATGSGGTSAGSGGETSPGTVGSGGYPWNTNNELGDDSDQLTSLGTVFSAARSAL